MITKIEVERTKLLSTMLVLSLTLGLSTAGQAKSNHHKITEQDTSVAIASSTSGDGDFNGQILLAKKDKDDDDSDDDSDKKKEKKKKNKNQAAKAPAVPAAPALPAATSAAATDKKDVKADNKDDKKTEKAEDDSEKKKGGLFHLGGGGKKKDKEEEKELKAENKNAKGGKAENKNGKAEAPKKENNQAATKPVQVEDPNAPKYKFDPALISVLKDINKTLRESEAVTKLEDPAQKLIARLVYETMDKALAAPDLHANRIVEAKDKERMEKSGMSTEAWESGNLDVSPELKASVVALWAKRIDGLVSVQVVGNYDGKADGASDKLGEFVAVITAHSTVDKGFDIQSQQDVNFWIGKVADLKIDCTSGKPTDANLKSYLRQYAPLTARKREYMVALKEYHDKLAKAEEEKKQQSELSSTQKVAEALAKSLSEALAKSGAASVKASDKDAVAKAVAEKVVQDREKAEASGAGGTKVSAAESTKATAADATNTAVKSDKSEDAGKTDKVASAESKNAGGSAAEKKAEGSSELNAARKQSNTEAPAQTNSTASAQDWNSGNSGNAATNNTVSQSVHGSSIAALLPDSSRNTRSNWDSPSAPTANHTPSASATLIYPGRAVAGQYVTVAVTNGQNNPEQYVGLSFNGAQLSTGENGKVVYLVPDDAPPGYSLHVALSARPEDPSSAIEVLQPLATPSSPQIPSLENVSPVCSHNGVLTIAGHNFDGIAERNRVIVDGAYDASVIVSSPVQVKAKLPGNIPAGAHTLCVSTSGLRSNPGNFDLVTVDLSAGSDPQRLDLRKLTVRVQGTQNRVRVKLTNQTRDTIKMLKGDEVVVVTSGGPLNQALVQVQRLRPGNYKIDTELLI